MHPCQHVSVSTSTHLHTHTGGKPKQGENLLPCHIPAVSDSSEGGGGGGCTMDTLYLAPAPSPTKVNPSVAACRTWWQGIGGIRLAKEITAQHVPWKQRGENQGGELEKNMVGRSPGTCPLLLPGSATHSDCHTGHLESLTPYLSQQ